MSDAAKIRAFEKMRDDISRVCSPQLSTSTTTVTNTPCVIPSTVSSTTSNKTLTDNNIFESDKLTSIINNKNNRLSSPPCCSAITSLSTINTNTEASSGSSSHFQSTNIGNGNAITIDYSNTTTSTSSTSALDSGNDLKATSLAAQLQRDREFRAQQSQPQAGLINSPMSRNVYRSTVTPIIDNKVSII